MESNNQPDQSQATAQDVFNFLKLEGIEPAPESLLYSVSINYQDGHNGKSAFAITHRGLVLRTRINHPNHRVYDHVLGVHVVKDLIFDVTTCLKKYAILGVDVVKNRVEKEDTNSENETDKPAFVYDLVINAASSRYTIYSLNFVDAHKFKKIIWTWINT